MSDLNWGIQREKRIVDSGSNNAPASQLGYSDTLLEQRRDGIPHLNRFGYDVAFVHLQPVRFVLVFER